MRPRTSLLAFALVATTLAIPPAQAQADPAVTVSVNARAGLESVSDAAIGVNHAVWDAELGTNAVADLMKNAGVQAMRYPGGSYSDIYHWRDNTAPGGYVAPNTDFDHFMAGVRRAGSQAVVIANYGTGTPQEAADWVRYANIEKNYGVKYWEIGNELYGNGHYGSAWEADDHADKSPAAYAENVKQFAQAMKAVDPTIKIGAVLTTPGNWPDGIVAGGDAGTWNQVVLSIAGPSVDFVILHWYPGGSGAADALSKTAHVTDAVWLVRNQITKYAHKDLGISLTEVNAGYGQNTQPGALFAADAYASLIAAGVFTIDWWNVHNGIGTTSTVEGQPDYGDFGLLSSGGCTTDGSVCEPPMNTPFAPYHALAMLSKFARPGDQLVKAAASDPLVKAHAARRANGDLAVLLVNEDPAAAKPVTLSYTGYSPAATAQVFTHGNGATAITTTTGSATSVTLAPYSLTTLVLRPTGAVTGPARPGRPAAGAVTATDATLTWAPSAGTGLKYEIHRQNGTITEQWGETTATTFTAHNLRPGTRYTVNVIARDGSGKVSWASPPVIFQTGTPAASSCAVTFADVNDWGNGYVGSIDITNTGTNPIDTWNLAFSWPTAWQQFNSGWNGTWTSTGSSVLASNADFNKVIAPGATVNIGLVGGYSGPNVPPALFTLNGTLCTTR
ncbi:cellulose binding domain-containing protein [Catellatospora sp. KI3]|uniref:cellulose binding domain-containing protein n=1 Tax=Catellatospora sp. KI3 TaxID=3041620 RepID=UPI0024823C45|nr:cellulose binding domain-containing protein [Catellatospora sp. KI3]MDI1463158.1 cellulose binding domain-containing protein [Catellatospora sp. KI3]